jgi:putative endonuclease
LKNIGKNGELLAANYLVALGYEVLDLNYFNHKGYQVGEIDIIAKDSKGAVVFIEVKSRKGEKKNWVPGENINPDKLRKIEKIANIYLRDNNLIGKTWRIDLIGVLFNIKTRKASICHIKAIRV